MRNAAPKLIALLVGLVLALAGLAVYQYQHRKRPDEEAVRRLMREPDIRGEATRLLIDRTADIWDSYVDADVSRVLLANLRGRTSRGVEIRSNGLGLRERNYSVAKPPGMVRVVLLGDSYVYGSGAPDAHRLGVHLQQLLRRGARRRAQIEVLHLGLESWNIIAECAYLRRQAAELAPDLVIHLSVDNDLEDVNGIRGFGSMGSYSPQVRSHADARLASVVPTSYWGPHFEEHHLNWAIDWEGRTRYELAEEAIGRLETILTELDVPYLHVLQWRRWNAVAREQLTNGLDDDQVFFISNGFHYDSANWVSTSDRHWNSRANLRVALMFYGVIQRQGLLPELELVEKEPALDELEEIHGTALRELETLEGPPELYPVVTCPPRDARMARQVYTGLDRDGQVGPYLSIVLGNEGATELLIEGESLGRPELRGIGARVWVEEFEVGTLDLGPEATYPVVFPLPAEVAGRANLSVRIVPADFVYARVWDGHGMAARLRELRLR